MSQYAPGPLAARILADLGAEVVKIEPPRGDPLRYVKPCDSDGVSVHYKLVNRGKTVIALDLKTAQGSEAFARLVSVADVVLESYRPGVLPRLGFGHGRLKQLNPRLVHCALSGYGQTGPLGSVAGHDLNYMAHSGGLALSGTAETPVISWPPVADHAGAMQAAMSILAALLARHRTGRGAFLDVSLADAVLAWQERGLTAASRRMPGQQRAAMRLNGGAACYHIYRTADAGFVTLAALEEKFWTNFCKAVGRLHWISRQQEPLPQTDLIREVAALIQSESLAAWIDRLSSIDCCFQPVLGHEALLQHPQIRARQLVRTVEGIDAITEVLYPVWIDEVPPEARVPHKECSVSEVLAAWQSKPQMQ